MKQSTIVQKYPGHLMSYHTAINLCPCLVTYLPHLRQSLPPPIPCPLPIHLRRNPGGGGGAIGTIWPCYSLPLFASLLPQIKTIWRWGIASRRRRRQTDQPSVAGRSVGRTRVIRRGTHTTESHRRRRLRKTEIFPLQISLLGERQRTKAPALIGYMESSNTLWAVSCQQ